MRMPSKHYRISTLKGVEEASFKMNPTQIRRRKNKRSQKIENPLPLLLSLALKKFKKRRRSQALR